MWQFSCTFLLLACSSSSTRYDVCIFGAFVSKMDGKTRIFLVVFYYHKTAKKKKINTHSLIILMHKLCQCNPLSGAVHRTISVCSEYFSILLILPPKANRGWSREIFKLCVKSHSDITQFALRLLFMHWISFSFSKCWIAHFDSIFIAE